MMQYIVLIFHRIVKITQGVIWSCWNIYFGYKKENRSWICYGIAGRPLEVVFEHGFAVKWNLLSLRCTIICFTKRFTVKLFTSYMMKFPLFYANLFFSNLESSVEFNILFLCIQGAVQGQIWRSFHMYSLTPLIVM